MYRKNHSPIYRIHGCIKRFGKEEINQSGFHLELNGASRNGYYPGYTALVVLGKELMVTIPEASSLLFKECDQFITMINRDKALKPSLKDNNVSYQNIDFSLRFMNEIPRTYYPFFVESIKINNGIVTIFYYSIKGKLTTNDFSLNEYQEFMRTGNYPFF